MSPCTITSNYSDSHQQATWTGRSIAEDADFLELLRGPVRARLIDDEETAQFEAEARALVTTGLSTSALEAALASDGSERKPWEVGEALAEVLLEDERDLIWPWNMERDKRTPRASLPGADLVGFISLGGNDAVLAIGEVKTSADTDTPPSVMTGRTGMAHQLERAAGDVEIQVTVLKWLRARCKTEPNLSLYKAAAKRYFESEGHEFVLLGSLIRDTAPHTLDLEARGRVLGSSADAPLVYELSAWYLPCAVKDLPSLVSEAAGA